VWWMKLAWTRRGGYGRAHACRQPALAAALSAHLVSRVHTEQWIHSSPCARAQTALRTWPGHSARRSLVMMCMHGFSFLCSAYMHMHPTVKALTSGRRGGTREEGPAVERTKQSRQLHSVHFETHWRRVPLCPYHKEGRARQYPSI
jgi:hypothetical protein